MLYTLFSPAESKNFGGNNPTLSKLLFSVELRKEILDTYEEIIHANSNDELTKLFGLKKESDILNYKDSIFSSPTMEALKRYDGVAYDYLKYQDLHVNEQNYLKEHVIIFSNLFGPIMGGDLIPNYKVKQGEHIRGIAPEQYYKKAITESMNSLLKGSNILDLRAGYYNKFYTASQPYHSAKFLKDGKVVSHWAKAYRGILLRALAINKIETVEEFVKMEVENLKVKDILHVKNRTEIVYEIIQ
ncbi:MAG: YaaA family protein [Campylobacterota bacterium]|nr:YaaA family protein [Campylobacterota bacterium]